MPSVLTSLHASHWHSSCFLKCTAGSAISRLWISTERLPLTLGSTWYLGYHLDLLGSRSSFTSERHRKHREKRPSGDDLLRGNIRSGCLSLHRWQHFSSFPLPLLSDNVLSACKMAAGGMSGPADGVAASVPIVARSLPFAICPCDRAGQALHCTRQTSD